MSDDIYILNPEGNNGNGRVTRYVGRGAGIRERINLIDILISANRAATAIVAQAEEAGEEFADISEPAHVAAKVKAELSTQAINN